MSTNDLAKHPYITLWRSVYKDTGADMDNLSPLIESVINDVLKGKGIPNINTVIDSCLITGCIHMIPIHGFDMQKVNGDIVLKVSSGKKTFSSRKGSRADITNSGEVVYSDDSQILSRFWNLLESDGVGITDTTTSFALFVEAPHWVISTENLRFALEELSDMLHNICGGAINFFIADISEDLVYNLSN